MARPPPRSTSIPVRATPTPILHGRGRDMLLQRDDGIDSELWEHDGTAVCKIDILGGHGQFQTPRI